MKSALVMDEGVDRLIELFNRLFLQDYNTELVCGEHEPIYLPADQDNPTNRIVFAHGYFSSALHEIAHWCIAGEHRRTLVDFGYWYEPDGRTVQQQRAFERVEVKPQALEWVFTRCAGRKFRVSADNLNGEVQESQHFKQAVFSQVQRVLEEGLGPRPGRLAAALIREFNPGFELRADQFELTDL